MKRLILLLLVAIMTVCLAPSAEAGVAEDFADAYEIRLAAAACLAAYSDRTGFLAREYLRQDGWEIIPFKKSSREADARFLLARNLTEKGRTRYVLAVVGTETFKDFQVDLRTDKVYFAGDTPDKFAANAKREDMPDTEPKVHRGFHEYVQTAFTARTDGEGQAKDRVLGELLADQSGEMLIVGHSLGGAAATIAGARLLATGVGPDQIRVITFGAPAVGNEAFGRQFSPKLNLTRVVIAGDPVTGVLQKLVGGYRQFGREMVWQRSALFEKGPHAMAEYLDLAMKNYYDRRTSAIQAGVFTMPQASPPEAGPRLYIVPPADNLPAELKDEYRYMEQAFADQYRRLLPGYVLGGAGVDPAKAAAAAGCRWYVVAELGGLKLKNERNQYFVTLHHTVYDTSGHVVYLNAYSSVTANMTPLEALTHDAAGAVADLATWMEGR
ncbi:lipase family protein [Anaeroselena agilis]|uniref:Lipase family protein n=1 Tax=Anaeroselena agilis TaxID=3063788 RepID=A0ABU3P3X1_9FIRM|nr:lipase family protein [Selenomonadales bacterium 4137-cl]